MGAYGHVPGQGCRRNAIPFFNPAMQFAFLIQFACPLFQGYLLGRPMPEAGAAAR